MTTQFNNVMFYPWVGKNYSSGINNKRILILGESIYCCVPSEFNKCKIGYRGICNSQVERIVKEQLYKNADGSGPKKDRFYTKISKLLLGLGRQNLTLESKESFWQSVAFYNYVQVSVGTKPRQRPTSEMWKMSIDSFIEVLTKLEPELIVITGRELSHNIFSIPNIWNNEIKTSDKGFAISKNLKYQNINAKAIAIYHPTYPGFSYNIMPFVLNLFN